MSASHYWGQRLIDSGILSAEQNDEIAANYLGSACPQDYPKPEPKSIPSIPAEDPEVIMERLQAEREAYEDQYGPLEPMRVNILRRFLGFIPVTGSMQLNITGKGKRRTVFLMHWSFRWRNNQA